MQVLADLVANFVSNSATVMFSEDPMPMVLWLSTSRLKFYPFLELFGTYM